MSELAYDPGQMTATELEDLIRDFLAGVPDDKEAQEDIAAAGIELDQVLQIDPNDVSVRSLGGGFGGVGEAIIIAVAVMLAEKLIDHVIVPTIKRRYGANVIGKKRD
jgi:hypothetical protein